MPVLLLDIFPQDLSHRGLTRIQQDLLKLIAMSNYASSLSHACKRYSSWLTEGDSIKMSSAYNIIQQPLDEEPNLLRSSKYKANRNGENTEPCRTPMLITHAVVKGIIPNDLEWLSKIQWQETSRGVSATAELLVKSYKHHNKVTSTCDRRHYFAGYHAAGWYIKPSD